MDAKERGRERVGGCLSAVVGGFILLVLTLGTYENVLMDVEALGLWRGIVANALLLAWVALLPVFVVLGLWKYFRGED